MLVQLSNVDAVHVVKVYVRVQVARQQQALLQILTVLGHMAGHGAEGLFLLLLLLVLMRVLQAQVTHADGEAGVVAVPLS